LPEIQDGNYRDEADSVSSIKQKCFCDTGAKLGRKKKKNTKKKQNSITPNTQLIRSFSIPHYTEKTGGLPREGMLAPRPAWETQNNR
jgi:hypothetical protein